MPFSTISRHISVKNVYVSTPYLSPGLQSTVLCSGFLTQLCTNSTIRPCVLYALSIFVYSVILITSDEEYKL
jgi:hypothetical protein